MWTYKEKDNFFYKLHPLTMVVYVTTIILMSLCFTNPVLLLGSFICIGFVMVISDNFKEWMTYLKFTLYLVIVIVFMNVIMVNAGATVLFSGPVIPVIGKFKITLEAIFYAIGMGIRLLLMTSAFCLYNYAVDPDKALKLFSKWGNKSVLMITLATRLYPLMLSDYKRISEVQRCRGVNYNKGKVRERIKKTLPLMSALLLSSLERSFQIAESMHARGYGSGRRTYFTKSIFRPRDYIIFVSLFFVVVLSIWTLFAGWGTYMYYPKLRSIDPMSIWMMIYIGVFLCVPAFIGMGWNKWHYLRSKI